MGQFDSLLRCTLGGTHFQLEDYIASVDPIVRSGSGRVGLTKRVQGTGWIEATTAADFASRLDDAQSKLAISDEDFRVYGLNGTVEYQITAAECVDGGPHAGFELLGNLDESGCYRKIRFTVEGATAGTPNTGDGVSLYQERIDTAASGQRRVTRTGELNRANAVAYFDASILPPFRSNYPLPNYVVSFSREFDERQQRLKYTLTADALATPLPQASGVNVVDGVPNRSFSRDEQDRVTIRYDFDLILDSVNYQPVLDAIRSPVSTMGLITRESASFDATKELRLRASFELLRGDGTDLLAWKQSFDITDPRDIWRIVTHPASQAFLVKAAPGMRVLVQQGTAVGAEQWPAPATPAYADSLVAEPIVRFEYGNNIERITTWTYMMAVDDLTPFDMTSTKLAPLLRPALPGFIT